jgi:putative toxin-antitoxin system antitoxin component (TIGR02293 family)
MAAKKGISTPGKFTHKDLGAKVSSSPAEGSIYEATAGSRSQILSEAEVSYQNTKRAISLLKSYRATFKSPAVKLTRIKKGLEAQAINDLIEISGATQATVASILDLTEPTLRKHIKAGKELNTGLSEHILQLFQLFDKGMDTFGSLEEFKNWMSHESIGLAARPVEVLDTMTGINMVMDELIRIDYGITV